MKQPARNYDTYTSMTSNSSAEDTSTREKATFANSLGRRTTLSPKTCVRFCCMETGCTSRFRRPYDLARHKKTIHGPKKLCSYESCTYATARSDKMNEHTRKKHAERAKASFDSEIPNQVINDVRYLGGNNNAFGIWVPGEDSLGGSADSWLQLWTSWAVETGHKDRWTELLPQQIYHCSPPFAWYDDWDMMFC